MEKLNYKARTIEDKIIKEGLKSIRTLNNSSYSNGFYSIIGGIATQSYTHSDFRRPTSDIDLLIGISLNYEDFRRFSKPVLEYLRDNNFKVKPSKRSRSFNLIIENKEGEQLLIEFSRRNKDNFKKSEKRIIREIENSRIKKIEGEKEAIYIVCSPEDIIAPKLVRSINSLEREPNFFNYLQNYKKTSEFSDEFMKDRLKDINDLRLETAINIGDLYLSEELKFISDIYDIILLTESVGINEAYFKIILNEWNSLKNKNKPRETLFNMLLPSTLHNL